jgi:hypothetical protein
MPRTKQTGKKAPRKVITARKETAFEKTVKELLINPRLLIFDDVVYEIVDEMKLIIKNYIDNIANESDTRIEIEKVCMLAPPHLAYKVDRVSEIFDRWFEEKQIIETLVTAYKDEGMSKEELGESIVDSDYYQSVQRLCETVRGKFLSNPPDDIKDEMTKYFNGVLEANNYKHVDVTTVCNAVSSYLVAMYDTDPTMMDPNTILTKGWRAWSILRDTAPRESIVCELIKSTTKDIIKDNEDKGIFNFNSKDLKKNKDNIIKIDKIFNETDTVEFRVDDNVVYSGTVKYYFKNQMRDGKINCLFNTNSKWGVKFIQQEKNKSPKYCIELLDHIDDIDVFCINKVIVCIH